MEQDLVQFAGFTFPQTISMLPRGPLSKRLEEFKQNHGKRACGPYYRDKPAANPRQMFFYLDSDFMPGLRWDWCDEVRSARITHTGWFTNQFQDDKIRGVVFMLPRGRGFLAGWSMGKGMASSLDYDIWDDITEAARDADRQAQRVAEAEQERNADVECPACGGTGNDDCTLCNGRVEIPRWEAEEYEESSPAREQQLQDMERNCFAL